jgi:hypothetical protein
VTTIILHTSTPGIMATEERARAVKRAHSARLLAMPGVSGVGVERDAKGEYFLAVHLAPPSEGAAELTERPAQLDGVPVHWVTSGPFRKLSR